MFKSVDDGNNNTHSPQIIVRVGMVFRRGQKYIYIFATKTISKCKPRIRWLLALNLEVEKKNQTLVVQRIGSKRASTKKSLLQFHFLNKEPHALIFSTRLYTPLCPSVHWLVGQSYLSFLSFYIYLRSLASPLPPKYSSDLKCGPCLSAHD